MHKDVTDWSERGSEVHSYPMEMCLSHICGPICNYIKRNDKQEMIADSREL